MVLSNRLNSNEKPTSVLSAPVSNPSANASASVDNRSMCRPIDNKRQPSSRVMRSACAPVIAITLVDRRSSARSACCVVRLSSPIIALNSEALAATSDHCSSANRSRTANAEKRNDERVAATLYAPNLPSLSARDAISARSKTGADCFGVGTALLIRLLLSASRCNHSSVSGVSSASLASASSVTRAKRVVFSSRSV